MPTEEEAAAPAENAIVAEQTEARDYDKEARANGWVPEAEFKGDRKPAQFLDAETFVKRGEEITPFVQKQNKQLRAEMEKKEADFAKRIERMEKATQRAFEAAEKQHKSEIARVKREQVAAVEAGDVKEFARLEKVKDELDASAPKADEKPDPATDIATRQEKWRADNPWFDDDFEMQEFAIKYSDFHGRKHPNLSFEDNMKVVEAEVRKKFPEKFGKSGGNGHATVDGGGSFPGASRKQGKSEADLPAEAVAAGKKYVAQGLYKDMKAYAKTYFEEL
jgi:hypothetical protein